MRQIEELFAYSVSTIIFLLGLTLIFLSLLIENGLVSSILIGFGIALCPAGLIGFLFQYLHEKVFVQKIESLIISKSIPQEIGIKRVFHNRKEFHEIRLKLYSNAKSRIYYLAVCPGYKDPGVFPGIEQWLKRGVNIRFLVCPPNKPFITQWFRIRSDDYPKDTTGGIERCLQELWAVKKKNNGPGEIDIKIYTASPGYYMQIIDDRLFVEPYLYGAHGGAALMIEFEKGHQFDLFYQHFGNLWDAGKPIDDLYLFSWDNVPGNDSGRLLRYLMSDHDIGWAENAEIQKSDDGKTIRIFKNENSAEIMINEKEEKATLTISDSRTHNLKVKRENNKLNMYDDFFENAKSNSPPETAYNRV